MSYRGQSLGSSPQRAMKQPTHLSEFSMPVKLREMGPIAHLGTGSSPPPPGTHLKQQQHSGPPPGVVGANKKTGAQGEVSSDLDEPWNNDDEGDEGSLPDAEMLAKLEQELQDEEGDKEESHQGNKEGQEVGGDVGKGQQAPRSEATMPSAMPATLAASAPGQPEATPLAAAGLSLPLSSPHNQQSSNLPHPLQEIAV